MRLNLRGNRFYLQALGAGILFIGMMWIFWFSSPVHDVNAQKGAPGTKTAIALTQQFLLGPFPTGTRPTPTASKTPTTTPTSTLTPTITLTPTAIRYFFDTLTPRTKAPGITTISPLIPTFTAQVVVNTPIPVRPTNTVVRPTNTSAPPIRPTNTAVRPTSTSVPPVQPTNPRSEEHTSELQSP